MATCLLTSRRTSSAMALLLNVKERRKFIGRKQGQGKPEFLLSTVGIIKMFQSFFVVI